MCPISQIHCPWVWWLHREEGSPSAKESADVGLKLTASQYANSLVIYLLLNDPPGASQEGIFLCRFKEKKVPLFPVDHLSLAHQSQGAANWKFLLRLRWMPLKVFTLIPISACVIPASSDTHGHTSLLPLPKHYSPFLLIPYCSHPPSQPALIRVMPAHHGAIWATRRIMGLHTGYNTTCSWVSKGEEGAAPPLCLCKLLEGQSRYSGWNAASRYVYESSCWLQHLGHFPNTSWHKSNRVPATLMCS